MSNVVKYIKENKMKYDIFDISKEIPDLSCYDRIGIVSGIHTFQAGKPLIKQLKEKLPERKEVFVIYAYGVYQAEYSGTIRELISAKESILLGEFGCIGFDGFGPFKVSGTTQTEPALEYELKECAKHIIELLSI
ncbi:MAG: hypothetical protein IJ397_02890 [Lachnospiraceae bacterium]|nr:hypothetical protein [Lachnospiraceae bacterium]